MLVLTRKIGETVIVHIPGRENPVRVTLVQTDKGRCRLGFEADRDIIFTREELTRRESNDAEGRQQSAEVRQVNERPPQDSPDPDSDCG